MKEKPVVWAVCPQCEKQFAYVRPRPTYIKKYCTVKCQWRAQIRSNRNLFKNETKSTRNL